jgi:hypothetical protein
MVRRWRLIGYFPILTTPPHENPNVGDSTNSFFTAARGRFGTGARPTGKSLQLLQHAPSAESRHGRAPYEREEAEEEEEEEEEPLLYHEFLRLLAACSGAATRTAGEAEAEVTLTNPLQVNSRTHVPIQLDKGILRSCLLYH